MLNVTVQATFGNGQSLDVLSDLIKVREKYFKETAKQAVTSIAITVMKSIRAATSIAKLHKDEIELETTTFKASTYKEGDKKIPCLRYCGNARFYPTKGEQVIIWTGDCKGVKMYSLQVYWLNVKYSKKKKTYLIVAPSITSAKIKAKQILTNRIQRYMGLARRALTVLMRKAALGNAQDDVTQFANSKAEENTFVTIFDNENSTIGTYGITLQDVLNYARQAIKGGPNAIDEALQKALNKATGTINQKFANSKDVFFTNQRIQTPFPEVKKRG